MIGSTYAEKETLCIGYSLDQYLTWIILESYIQVSAKYQWGARK